MAIGANYRGRNDGPYETAEQIDELLDELRRLAGEDAPITAYLYLHDKAEDMDGPLLHIGVSTDKGYVMHGGPNQEPVVSYGGGSDEIVHYCFQDTPSEYPAWTEIPFDTVKAAARQFLETDGGRPSAPTWRPADELERWTRTAQQ